MKLYAGGYLTFYMPGRQHWAERQLEVPTPLTEILVQLKIPLGEVHLVSINGEQTDLEQALVQDADEVRIYSSVDGG
jgi:hypothetical protein